MPNIRVSHERERGCGYRKEGGLYLVLPEFKGQPCGKLPLTLDRCPCCGAGIKFARGWTWIDGKLLFGSMPCNIEDDLTHHRCIIGDNPPEKMGLIWIGEKFYKTPDDWLNEGRDMGVSRRIQAIPNGFKTGETWVAVAHIDAIPGAYVIEDGGKQGLCDHEPNARGTACKKCKAKKEKGKGAIFQVFKPSDIEYIVKGTETEEELTKLEERGISLVKVVKIIEQKTEKQAELPPTQEATA